MPVSLHSIYTTLVVKQVSIVLSWGYWMLRMAPVVICKQSIVLWVILQSAIVCSINGE